MNTRNFKIALLLSLYFRNLFYCVFERFTSKSILNNNDLSDDVEKLSDGIILIKIMLQLLSDFVYYNLIL